MSYEEDIRNIKFEYERFLILFRSVTTSSGNIILVKN